MSKVEELKDKYPHHNVKYNPQLDCRACKGRGEHLNGYKEMKLCICTCVRLDEIGGLFMDFVDRELRVKNDRTNPKK